MTFKPGAHELMAAIAVGNPDKADHVTVTTPGMNTHASSMPALVDQASALKAEMENQLELAGQPDADVSTIAWFGYDPPDTRDRTVLGALSEDRANAGAVDLANLYRGINATNERGSDVHLSAFGHSYGSMTTAQALNELGETGVVDAAAFYGSPGLGYANERVMGAFGKFITDEPDLFLEQGHGYVMSAHNDPVSEEYIWNGISLPALADAGAHGPNPNTLPLEQLGTDAAVTPDGVSRSGAVGHSQYPRTAEIQTPTGKRDVLRTTGYNLAIIGAGLAHGARELLVR
jgi:hypothetical protein